MSRGLVEDNVKWHRHGLAEPWLPDSFMAELSPEAIGRLERHATLLTDIDKTDWTSQQAPVAVVLSGVVRVWHVHSDGHQALVRIAGLGDLINGENILTAPVSALRFQGTQWLRALIVPRNKFRTLLDDDEEIRRALLRTFAQRLRESEIHQSHSGRKVEHRLWAFLVGLGRRHGFSFDGNVEVNLGLTQAHLAAAVGASHHSVEAALQRLRQARKLTTRHTGCVLHELPSEEELDRSFS